MLHMSLLFTTRLLEERHFDNRLDPSLDGHFFFTIYHLPSQSRTSTLPVRHDINQQNDPTDTAFLSAVTTYLHQLRLPYH
jgi:hypothetical protein